MIQSVNKYHIYEIFASDGKFYYSIPKYQREYTWNGMLSMMISARIILNTL